MNNFRSLEKNYKGYYKRLRKRVEKYSSIERIKSNVSKEIGDKIPADTKSQLEAAIQEIKDNTDNGLVILNRNTDNYSLPSGSYILSGNPGENCTLLLQATRNGSLAELARITDTTGIILSLVSSTLFNNISLPEALDPVSVIIFISYTNTTW